VPFLSSICHGSPKIRHFNGVHVVGVSAYHFPNTPEDKHLFMHHGQAVLQKHKNGIRVCIHYRLETCMSTFSLLTPIFGSKSFPSEIMNMCLQGVIS